MATSDHPAVDPEPAAGSAHAEAQSSATQPAAAAAAAAATTTTSEQQDGGLSGAGERSLDPALSVKTATDKETGADPSASTRADDGDSDIVNPPDFQGEVLSNDELPSPETIRRIGDYIVLDRHGKTHTFKSLYTGRNVARRILIIFVRHFYCGNCQEYLRTLSASINAKELLSLPISTFIAVIGCGDPALIDMYASETGCEFPIYADPTRKLYQELGMVKTLALGQRPAYMSKSLLKSSLDSIVQGVKQIKSGLAIKGGDQRQIGGEFLFEPVDLRSPDASPVQEFNRRLRLDPDKDPEKDEVKMEAGGKGEGAAAAAAAAAPGSSASNKHSRTTSTTDNDNDEVEEPLLVEEKKVTWCHRMRTTRDHAEIPELMEILGLHGQGKPIKDQKRWSKALEQRKGTGLSMAPQMSRLSQQYTASGAESS